MAAAAERDKTRLECSARLRGERFVPLGKCQFQQATMTIPSGHVLAMFSRGIRKACDAQGREVDENRVAQVLKSYAEAPAEEQMDAVFAQVADGEPNDRTVVVVRRLF